MSIFLGHDFKLYSKTIVVTDDIFTYRCKPCRQKYDAIVLGSDICPRCKKAMKFAKNRSTKIRKLSEGGE